MENYRAMYEALHAKGPKVFSGSGDGWGDVDKLVAEHKPRSILDYGCGKGNQYFEHQRHRAWGFLPELYDIGYKPFQKKPAGPFDAVLCMDVMEHIAEPDVLEVLTDIFSYLVKRDDGGTSFAYFWISCRPAKRKTLPDGRNVHLTVQKGPWWHEKLMRFQRPGLIIKAQYEYTDLKP